ncbi:bacteriophage abortive infection AbiH family protein [Dysgonomonas sp. OttesenSCG-928-D17]|nr:bacteriophage abortive infection AbiH family protein [Dysgonomonas sp. OttesenSCG-928-D17]
MRTSNRLYIIGNGFDRYHRMETSYSDFCRYIQANKSELYDFLESYFYMETDKNKLWCQFERDLGTFDYELFFSDNDNTEPMAENFRPSFIYGLEDDLQEQGENLSEDIREAFRNWLIEADIPENGYNPLNLDKYALFLSFNYTNTLPYLYDVPINNILYIHGSVEGYDDLIFGHNKKLDTEPDFDKYGEPTRTPYTDAESASKIIFNQFHKDVTAVIKENCNFFNSLKDIDEVIVLGHSLNDIDLPYYSYLVQKIKADATWSISWYDNKEKTDMEKALIRAGINKHFSFIRIEDLIV